MAKKDDLDDILGTNAQSTAAPTKGDTKAMTAAATPAAKPAAKAAPKPVAKPKAAAKPVAKPKAAAAKPKAKAKAAKAPATDKAARGEGARYIAPEEKDAIRKLIVQKVRKPMTTIEVGEAIGHPAWKVRRSARALVAEGRYTMDREGAGGPLTLAPAKGK